MTDVRTQIEGTGPYHERGDGLDYVRHIYGVEVELGQRIACNGALGTVVFDPRLGSHYVHVRFDDGHVSPCHPTWEMDYSPASASDDQHGAGQGGKGGPT